MCALCRSDKAIPRARSRTSLGIRGEKGVSARATSTRGCYFQEEKRTFLCRRRCNTRKFSSARRDEPVIQNGTPNIRSFPHLESFTLLILVVSMRYPHVARLHMVSVQFNDKLDTCLATYGLRGHARDTKEVFEKGAVTAYLPLLATAAEGVGNVDRRSLCIDIAAILRVVESLGPHLEAEELFSPILVVCM